MGWEQAHENQDLQMAESATATKRRPRVVLFGVLGAVLFGPLGAIVGFVVAIAVSAESAGNHGALSGLAGLFFGAPVGLLAGIIVGPVLGTSFARWLASDRPTVASARTPRRLIPWARLLPIAIVLAIVAALLAAIP